MRVFLLCVAALLVLAGCEGSPGVEGKYLAQGQDGKNVTLTLKAGFTGEWETATDSVPVRWEVRGGEVWLHSKSGGILRGILQDGTLRVVLPGEGELVFARPGAKPGG